MKEIMKKAKERLRVLLIVLPVLMANVMFAPPAYAEQAGNVSGAIEDTWNTAAAQVKDVVNNVVFPIVDCVLAILLFVKLAMSYFDYKKHGEFDFMPPAILFFGLLFSLTAPLYVWDVVGL